MAKKRKPKFTLGQVVFLDDEGRYFEILSSRWGEDGEYEYQILGDYWWSESGMRPLTPREKGGKR